MSKTINLGAVTAYADAVAAGYTGTREQFANDLANAANYASAAGASATAAAASETIAANSATAAAASAEAAAGSAADASDDAAAALAAKGSAEAASATAVSKAGEATNAAESAGNSATSASSSATAAAGSATAAAGSATNAAASETAAAGSATSAAGSASSAAQTLTDVNAAGATQVALIQTKGAETLASIPSDYTTLSNDVSDLKSNLNDNVAQLKDSYGILWDVQHAYLNGAIKVVTNAYALKAVDVINVRLVRKVSDNYAFGLYYGANNTSCFWKKETSNPSSSEYVERYTMNGIVVSFYVYINWDAITLNTNINTTIGIVDKYSANPYGTYIIPEMVGAVGDGVTDDTTAVTNAISYFKNVKLNSTYKVSNILISNVSNIKLFGDGGLIFSDPAQSVLKYGLRVTAASNVKVNGIVVTTLTSNFQGLYGVGYELLDFYGCSNVIVDSVTVHDTCDGVAVTMCQGVTVNDCQIYNCGEECVVVRNSQNVKVTNNNLYNYCGDCVLLKGGSDSYNFENYEIMDNYIHSSKKADQLNWVGGGITYNCENDSERNGVGFVISRNIIRDALYGIILFNVDNVSICGNSIREVKEAGIGLEYSEEWSWAEIPMNNCIVANNLCSDILHKGISLTSSFGMCLAVGNLVANAGTPMTISEDVTAYGNLY